MKILLIILIVINALMGFAGLVAGTTPLDRVLGAIGFLDICVLLGSLHVANAVASIKSVPSQRELPPEMPLAQPR